MMGGAKEAVWKHLGRFAAVWLLLPNIPFIALSVNYCPSRSWMVLAYGVIGLNRRALSAAVILPLFAILYFLDLGTTLAKLFGLPFDEMLAALGNVADIHLLAEPRYVGLGLLALSGLGLTLFFGRRMHQVPIGAALLLLLAAAAADIAVNTDPAYGAKPVGIWTDYWTAATQMLGDADERTAVGAMDRSGLAAAHLAGNRRNLLVVVVESLGKLNDAAAEDRLYAAFDDPAITRRYALSRGTVPYSGSTTAGEMRELCGRRDSYLHYLDGPPDGVACLPARLRDQGYRTLAVHAFTKDFFQRDRWYPAIGFERAYFAEEHGDRLGRCGNVFAGSCDHLMGGTLRQLLGADPQQPKLVYWLTLNSHFPVAAEDLPAGACSAAGPADDPMVCRMAALWREVFAVVAGLAADDGLPPMDILIVGDHAPPLFSRNGRAAFMAGAVPWLALSRK